VFKTMERPKHHRKRGTLPEPTVFKKSPDESLCPVKSLKTYLNLTRPVRIGDTNYKLLLSHQFPHKSVTNDTIRRWLKTAISEAGVDVSVVQGHSIRSTSSSAAQRKGASISEILASGGWGKASVWQKFYNMELA